MCTNQGFKTLVPDEGVDNWFLYYQMRLHKGQYERFGIGSTFLEVSKRDTEAFEVDLPPFPEQCKIARILSTVDDLIERTEALIAKYRAIKQGLMHDLLTAGWTRRAGCARRGGGAGVVPGVGGGLGAKGVGGA